jgi:hypothetical protein
MDCRTLGRYLTRVMSFILAIILVGFKPWMSIKVIHMFIDARDQAVVILDLKHYSLKKCCTTH